MASLGPSLDVCDFLQEQIEELSFVDDAQKLKKYRCCACENVAISHCIANCGNVFSTKCYLNYFRKTCPYCEAKLTSNKEDDEFESAILELKVKCKFKKNGCEEIISVIDFLKHIQLCKFASDKLLSKLHRENPVAETLQQQTDDENRKKTAIKEDLQKSDKYEKGQIKHEIKSELSNEIKTLHAVNSQMVLANKDEIRELTKNVLEVEILTEDKMKNIEALYSASSKNFTEEWNNNKTSILTEIQDLKNEMQESRNQNDTFRATLEGTINSLVKKINDNCIQNKAVMDRMQTEFTNLKRTVQENERSTKSSLKELESRHKKRFDELENTLMSASGRDIQLPEDDLYSGDHVFCNYLNSQ